VQLYKFTHALVPVSKRLPHNFSSTLTHTLKSSGLHAVHPILAQTSCSPSSCSHRHTTLKHSSTHRTACMHASAGKRPHRPGDSASTTQSSLGGYKDVRYILQQQRPTSNHNNNTYGTKGCGTLKRTESLQALCAHVCPHSRLHADMHHATHLQTCIRAHIAGHHMD